jgi:hypothetical protein
MTSERVDTQRYTGSNPVRVAVNHNSFLTKMLSIDFSADKNGGGERIPRKRWRKPFLTVGASVENGRPHSVSYTPPSRSRPALNLELFEPVWKVVAA